MCECGCNELTHNFKFPAPNNMVYVISIYTGCKDCDAPAGVIISKMAKSMIKELVIDADSLEITEEGIGLPLVDFHILTDKLWDRLSCTNGAENVLDELKDILEEETPDCVFSTVTETIEKHITAGNLLRGIFGEDHG